MEIVDLPSGGGGVGSGTFFYDSIAILRQESRVTVLVDDTPATVYGLLARGDGLGGGFYFYDASSVLVDDGISIVQPGSIVGAGRWIKFLG